MTVEFKQPNFHFKMINDVVVIDRRKPVEFNHCEIAEWKSIRAKKQFDEWFDQLEEKYNEEQLNKYY